MVIDKKELIEKLESIAYCPEDEIGYEVQADFIINTAREAIKYILKEGV